MKITSVREMRDLDKRAIQEYAIKEELLMENAGLASFQVLQKEVGISDKFFLILCGIGNNGGDALVVARKLLSLGGNVTIVYLADPQKFKGAAKINQHIISKLAVDTCIFSTIPTLLKKINRCDCIIDGIFGTGLSRPIEGDYKKVINLINESGKPVFSLDIPSGINGDNGEIMGIAVKADYTVTFGLPKLGNICYPGFSHNGKLYVTHISFPPALINQDSLKTAVNNPSKLPARAEDGHKGHFGDALFIAGAATYLGAPYFSALSFLKAGGGYSRLAAPRSICNLIGNKGSEIVLAPQGETASGSLAWENKADLLKLSEQVDMVVMGPGLSLVAETQQLVLDLVEKIDRPLLIDGDGLTAICKNLLILKNRKQPTILTPHLGEMSRICNLSIEEILKNRVSILQEYAHKLNSTIVLKGAHSMIGFCNGHVAINLTGNSGMASAGSGDVLTGTIAAMFGLGLSIEESVKTGVFIHGLAGDLAAKDLGLDGITAGTILDYLPLTLKRYRQDYPSHLSYLNHKIELV